MYMITLLDPPKRESVRQLQQTLFPVSNNLDEEDNEESLLAKKDSKELFAVIRDPNSAIQPARWPTECQVIDEEIKHIYYVPPTVEPFYVPTGKEVQPKPVGDKFGLIIYQYYPISAVNYFSRSNVGGSPYLLPTCPCPEEDCLRFESRFESGNLAKVIKITAVYYELYLRNDLYTNKHMQWYYFRVTNMKKNVMYRFSIVNMTKEESLYNDGMRPLLYSTKDAQLHSIGWRRCGDNISYYCNDNPGSEEPDQFPTYTLTFTLEFPHEGDTVYLAYSYPYTYSDLQDYLLELTKHPVKSTYTTLRLLCKTLAGNNLYYVTVTSPQEPNEERKKKAIIVTARVHPGETPSSWMMKGFLDFLTGDTGPAKELREKFIFKLVPMLNPDGVIVGNSRCSLMGTDLNRQYRTVLREAYPSIWYTKLMIRRMIDECGVAMYCDLHAHSRKHNIFVYGCENRRLLDKRLGEQVFPLMLHKNAADKFSFENCLFRIQRCKEGTGRVVMWMMGIANSYTMEASFAGTLMGARAETHFTPQDYEQMGKSFCQTLLDFYDDDPRKERLRTKIIERLMKEGSNAFEPTNIPLSDYSSDDGDSASTSSDEAGREDFTTPLVVPPPSPALTKSKKPKTALAKMRTFAFKNQAVTNEQRKTLPVRTIFTNNIGLTLPRNKSKYTSYSSSNSDSDDSDFKAKLARKRRTKRRTRKQRQAFTKKQTEVEPVEVKSPPRSLSVLDLLPSSKLRSQSWHRLVNPLPPPKPLLDARIPRTTTQQLAEVQAKLVSLKNRLWMVTGQGDANIPLSWGPSKLSDAGSKTTKRTAVISRQKSKIDVRQEKPDKTSVKPQTREASKQKSAQKKQNGLRRQMCVWIPPVDLNNIRKNSSFSDSSIKRGKSKSAVEGTQGCEEEKAKSQNKKKRRKNKLLKKATTVTNVNAFFRKDKD